MMSSNLDAIRTNGLAGFLDQQRIRMGVLRAFMADFDDGRSKSFFCLACALLPLTVLLEADTFAAGLDRALPLKQRNRELKAVLTGMARESNVELKLRRKQ